MLDSTRWSPCEGAILPAGSTHPRAQARNIPYKPAVPGDPGRHRLNFRSIPCLPDPVGKSTPPHTPRASGRRRWTALEPHIGRALLEGSNLVSIPITKLPDSTSFARSRPEPPFCQRRYKERYRVFRTYSPYIPALSMPDYSCETVNLAVFRSMQPRLGSFWTIPRSHTKQ